MKLPQLPNLDENFNKKIKKKKKSIERPKMPKSEYNSDGVPILNVPDLNDVNLTNEIDRYFGETKEEE